MKNFKKRKKSRFFLGLAICSLMLTIILILNSKNNTKYLLQPPISSIPNLESCITLNPKNGPYKEAVIRNPGVYCLGRDFWQLRLHDGAGHSGPAEYRRLIEVTASDVTIDLAKNVLHSSGHSSGIAIGFDVRKEIDENNESMAIADTITIQNGVIDLRGLGTAVFNLNQWEIRNINNDISLKFKKYKKSKIILQNILIKTDNIGILLEGDGNIIRNCIIESGGRMAIGMAGPNGKIINNRIILTAPLIPGKMKGTKFNQTRHFGRLLDARREIKAAIILHQATNTLISGNRIEVKEKSRTRHNILLTDASTDVHVEENTFVGAEDPVTLVGGSTATINNNSFEASLSWWRF